VKAMDDFAIGANDTIVDVLPRLSEPEKYVREVLSTMFPCHRKHGNAKVQIGRMGEGKMPYHKVIFQNAEGTEELYDAYAGTKPFENVKIHKNTWSAASMTLEEVQEL